MPLKIPAQSLVLIRDGARVEPPVGQPFKFTDDEIAEIEQSAPDALMSVNVREAEKIVEAAKAPQDTKPSRGRKSAAKDAEDDDDL